MFVKKPTPPSFFRKHSLSIVVGLFLILWLVLYSVTDERKHWGGFFGNAIADWTGALVMIQVTKYFYEKGSPQSKEPKKKKLPSKHMQWIHNHSLSIFLSITGIAWVFGYMNMDSQSKWGQVVGNIVSEWTQLFCLLVFTRSFIERGSKESK